MADIFISYSREDREWVESFAAQVQSEGFSVWWDWDLLVGKRYRETIDHELQGCRVAVVVWSQHSIQSDFVRDEAEEAQQRNVLVPVLKEIVRPPAGFRQIQTADLSTWTGGGTHAEFRRVMKGIANMVGRPPTVGSAEAMPSVPPPLAPQATPVSAPMATAANRQSPIATGPSGASQLLAKLPPAEHHIWRYVAFGVIALIGLLLIISQFVAPNSKSNVASVVNGHTAVDSNSNTSGSGNTAGNGNTAGTGNTTPPQPPAPTDAGDIGQTGPHTAVSPPAGGSTGDSGDIGQGGTH